MLDESEERSYVIIPSLPQQAERGLLHTSVPLTHPTQTFFKT